MGESLPRWTTCLRISEKLKLRRQRWWVKGWTERKKVCKDHVPIPRLPEVPPALQSQVLSGPLPFQQQLAVSCIQGAKLNSTKSSAPKFHTKNMFQLWWEDGMHFTYVLYTQKSRKVFQERRAGNSTTTTDCLWPLLLDAVRPQASQP